MPKIVINKCFGGFGLSDTAMREWAKRKNYGIVTDSNGWGAGVFVPVWASPDLCHGIEMPYDEYMALAAVDRELASELGSPKVIDAYRIPRDDGDLVDIVTEMGKASFGDFAQLAVVDIPDGIDWYVEEYDGREHIAQHHQTWG